MFLVPSLILHRNDAVFIGKNKPGSGSVLVQPEMDNPDAGGCDGAAELVPAPAHVGVSVGKRRPAVPCVSAIDCGGEQLVRRIFVYAYSLAACRVAIGTWPTSKPAGGVTTKAGSISASFPAKGGGR